jgi:hypothetical protein
MKYSGTFLILYFSVLFYTNAYSQGNLNDCQKAFLFKSGEYAVVDTLMICNDTAWHPVGYKANLNMAVCNDGLCARLILKVHWDLAGTFTGYDTVKGHPLTKFDHKPFDGNDYLKLNDILKDKNSILGTVVNEDLTDKNTEIKATYVDAVTSATSKAIKNSVVDGAVYTTYALWHFIHSSVTDSMRSQTVKIFTRQIALLLLNSDKYDSQLFALKKMSEDDYLAEFPLLLRVIRKSVPFIKSYMITIAPLPFADLEKNKEFVSIFSELDNYSKSVFIDRITGEKKIAVIYLPLIASQVNRMDTKQIEKCILAVQKYKIALPIEFKKS